MENYYAASYPDSVHSSPRSRDIDFEHPPPQWEDTNNTFNNNNNKVKFMCSYGGKIQPRPHDNNLSYVGGETKIISADRSVSLSSFLLRLRSVLSSAPDTPGGDVSFKYQLPGEDLDALISVTNDDDLNHMMSEYDRLCRSAPSKPARLRLFLFTVPSTQPPPPPTRDEKKFPVVAPTPVAATAPPNDADFLFSLGKPVTQLPKPRDPVAVPKAQILADRVSSPDLNMVPPDIERHIRDLQRLQIQDQAAFQLQHRRGDERVEYYAPNPQEKSPPSNFPPTGTGTPPVYWQENQVGGAVGYPAASGGERPVYMVPAASAGVYHPPPSGGHAPPPQGFYPHPIQRMGSDVYRELPATYGVFAAASGPAPQPAKVVGYSEGVGMGMGRQAAEVGYAQVAYDSAGRQVYYTAPYPGMAAVSADMRQQQQSGPFSSEGNAAPKVSQNSM